ncbi:P68 family surface lipoprotein [Metamycoplasma canadense]|uniref:Lipoprotein n=1 Tax=Metamycoplasma canadense TaxID=29554 RepID=A0A077LBZ9_9BACT|nr:P80 family lipoprotein [Metamycoplasma canadense]BAP39649.1 hypothetical protein MCAN360_0533 [Metamycoplasma canadense]
MKKINKVLLSISGLSAFSLPLLAISCGSPRWDQNYDGILKIATGFSETNEQGIALKTIVDEYNKWRESGTEEEKAQKQQEGHLKVEVNFLPNGYNTGPLTTKIGSKEQNTLWNIIINYPTAASILAQRKMNLALSNDEYEKLDIVDAFKNVNDDIGGNTSKEKWVVPMSRSSEMQSINKVVLGKFLKELSEIDGIKKDEQNMKKVKEYIDYYKSVAETDGKYVDEHWSSSKATNLEEAKEAIKKLDLTISDNIFKEYESLIKFAIAAKRLYPLDLAKPILGIDSLASVINVMNVAVTKGDKSKQYINPSPSHKINGGFDYESFIEEGTEQNKLFKSLLNVIFEGIKTGAVWIGGGGAYGSNLLTKHNMAISIGSTAGYSHTFIKSTENKTYNYLLTSDDKKEYLSTNDLVNILEKEKEDGVVLKFGQYKNKIYSSSYSKEVTGYNKKLSSKELEDKLLTNFKLNPNFKLVKGTFDEQEKNVSLTKDISFKLKDDIDNKIVNLGKIFENDDANYILIDKDLVKTEQLTSSQLLNEIDADWISTPLVKNLNNDKKSVFIQGPSLVLIHANEKEDKATKLFVKWLFDHKLSSITFIKNKNSKNFSNIKPIDAFNEYGNYISPTKSYFNNKEAIKKLNKANKIAFDNFKSIIDKPNEFQPAEDVSSSLSDKLRDAIGSGARKILNKVSRQQATTIDELVKIIIESFK